MRIFARLLQVSALVAIGGMLISANQHLQTSANPISRMLAISYLNNTLQTKLDAPGTRFEKDQYGHLQHLSFFNVQNYFDLTFHSGKRRGREQVASVRQFRVFGDELLLHGPSYTLDDDGHKLTERHWHEGKLHGPQKSWNSDHQLTEERYYEKGYPVNTWRQYYGEGGVASTMSFPEHAALWEETKVHYPEDQHGGNKSLHAASLHRSLTAKEQWYSSSGAQQRERQYRVYRNDHGAVVESPGATITYGPRGEVVRTSNVRYGNGSEVFYHQGANPHNKTERWLNGTQVRGTYGPSTVNGSPSNPFDLPQP